jgi:serine/threonine-protein kinase
MEAGRSQATDAGDTHGRWERVEALLDQALDRPAEERTAFVESSAASPRVRDEVLQLLSLQARDGILDHAAPAMPIVADDATAAMQELNRAFAGRYRIDRLLGEGGSASVYLAHEAKHDRVVVLKVLKEAVATWIGPERFRAEIHILAHLSHPHIVPLLDSGELDGRFYFVMPYLGGETLRDRLRRGYPEAREAQGLLRDVARALAHAHRANLVHRDLKPGNVLYVDRHAYLMDFGIAKLPEYASATATIEGVAIGTPDYMAPEQRSGGAVDARTDVYGWGLVARDCLDPRASDRRSLAIQSLIAECLSGQPSARPANGGALVERLEQIEGSRPDTSRVFRQRVLAALGVGAASLGALWLWQGRGPRLDLGAVPSPIAVTPFRNETGDSSLAVWGRMAGDWLTQGLLETGEATVVPWSVSLDSWRAEGTANSAGVTSGFLDATKARAVVTGSYYITGDRVQFQAQLADAEGRLIAALPAAVGHRDSMNVAIGDLRDRLMGMLAFRADERVRDFVIGERPPRYAAYTEFERGIALYNRQAYAEGADALLAAWRADTTFTTAYVLAARSWYNAGNRPRADSLARALRTRGSPVSAYVGLELEYLESTLAGDGRKAYAAIAEAARRAPGGRAGYNVALVALNIGRPREAIATLRALDPDRGALKAWAPYWYVLTHALHLVGDYSEEWKQSVELRRRHPDARPGWVHLVRAAAAVGRLTAIDSLLALAAPLPPDTYWSQGAMMVIAAEELDAHGHDTAAGEYYAQATRWLANQLTRDPNHIDHRYWLGSAYYDQGQYAAARPYFASLAEDRPNDLLHRGMLTLIRAHGGGARATADALGPVPPFNRTGHIVFRARLAGVTGDTAAALAHWSEAVGAGLNGIVWLHASARSDLGPVRDHPAFQRLGILPGLGAEPRS